MKLDQHFMIDRELCKRVVDALEIKRSDTVLEIGGGGGALTREIAKKTENLTVIEIDAELCRLLRKSFPSVHVLHQNALMGEMFSADKIIGNLPYSICEPFMKKLLKSKFKRAVLTVPKSFLYDGLLRKIMPLFFRIKTLEFIPSASFSPQPKTESKVILITPRTLKQKAQLVKEVYLQSDKVLKNALREGFCRAYGLSRKDAMQQMPELSFLKKKVYTLKAEEWFALLEALDIRG